jgi:hypothetical protein
MLQQKGPCITIYHRKIMRHIPTYLLMCVLLQQEGNMNDDPYDQVLQALTQAEISRRSAFDESMRRRKAEKVAMDAICKVTV